MMTTRSSPFELNLALFRNAERGAKLLAVARAPSSEHDRSPGVFTQPICSGKELGMFEMNVPVSEGGAKNPDDQAMHLLQAWAARS